MPISPIDPHTIDQLATGFGVQLITLSAKGLVLLSMAIALSAALRRGPAAARHLVWTSAVVGLLALPLLGAALPGWSIPGVQWSTRQLEARDGDATTAVSPRTVAWRPREDATVPVLGTEQTVPREGLPLRTYLVRTDAPVSTMTPITDFEPAATSAAASRPNVLARLFANWSPWTWALLVWETGALLVLGWLAIGWWHLRALRRRSRVIEGGPWLEAAHQVADELGLRRVPTLLRTQAPITPLTWGVRRPMVLLPESADEWPRPQRIDVLRHELAHVQRRDVLTQSLAQIACVVFWFHPLPWIAAARMRLERERACDDRVLLAGSRASSYAGHLLDMARSLRSEHSLAAATIGMARRSQLGERMDSILDDAPRGRRLNLVARLALLSVLGIALIPLAALRPHTTQAAPPERDDFPVAVAPRVAGAGSLRIGGVAPVPSVPAVPPIAAVAGIAPRAFDFGNRSLVRLARGTMFTTDGDFDADSYEIDARHTNFVFRDDGVELEVEFDGRMRFAEDETDIEWMEDGASFDLRWEEGRERRRMEIEADRDGTIERTYYEGGKRTDIDDEARTWFASALSDFMVRAGIATGPRVERWVREKGVDGAMDRIEALDSDFVAAHHWSALLELEDLSADDRAKALASLPKAIESDFEKNRVLDAALPTLLADPSLVDEVVTVIESMDSDFERRRAISLALSVEGLDEATLEQLIVAVEGMDSDFEKIEALRAFPRRALDADGSQRAYLRALGHVDSDFERARGLAVILDGRTKMQHAPMVFELADGMDSDFEKARVLVQALPLALDDADARAKMWNSIAGMESDFEKARILGGLLDRIEDDETILLEALTAIGDIDGEFEKSRLLQHYAEAASAFPSTRARYLEVAEDLDGDHEYGKVMRALRRNEP